MYVFCVGMERCGTHSLANIVSHACVHDRWVRHEAPPEWCREARLRFEGLDYKTDDFYKKLTIWSSLSKDCDLIFEANHRLGFFVDVLYDYFGATTKFIWLLRHPVANIISRISNWSYWPEILDRYPLFFQHDVQNKIPQNKMLFNVERLRAVDMSMAFIDLYIWEWLETYKYNREQISSIPQENRFIINIDELTNGYGEILDFIGKEYFINELASQVVLVKADSVHTRVNNDDVKQFAVELVANNYNKIVNTISTHLCNKKSVDHNLDRFERSICVK